MKNDGIGVFIVRGFCLFCSPHGNEKVTLRDQIHREFVNRPFQFDKRSQYFIGADDETLSVAMRVNDPDCSPFRING
jgi:hypothetical protein